MSMLSAQCDELRAMAESVGLEVPQAATLMMEAADTITELRDDLQRANGAVRDAEHDESMAWDRVRKAESESDRLREERDMYRDLVGMMDHPDLNAQLQAENAKLRELVANVHEALCLDKTTLFREAIIKSLEDDMRELGVEVDS